MALTCESSEGTYSQAHGPALLLVGWAFSFCACILWKASVECTLLITFTTNTMNSKITKAQLTKMYSNKQQSCKARKIAFQLSKEEYRKLILSPVCAYTGIELTINTTKTNARKATDVTLERVNCEQGYTLDNTIAVCHAANSAKAVFDGMLRDDGIALLRKMAEAVSKIESQSVVKNSQKKYSLTQQFVLWLNKVVGLI